MARRGRRVKEFVARTNMGVERGIYDRIKEIADLNRRYMYDVIDTALENALNQGPEFFLKKVMLEKASNAQPQEAGKG